jgi:hypothetical protein
VEPHWLTRPATIRKLWWLFIILLAGVVLAGLLIRQEAHFSVEDLFGFNALFGFLACAALILVAKGIGVMLKRPDTYYDKDGHDA